MGLGSLVMFGTGLEFSNQGGVFAGQLIQLYTSNLGDATYGLIAVAAFSTIIPSSEICVFAIMFVFSNSKYINKY